MCGGPVSFGATTQSLTAQSTVEAELMAISYTSKEAVYLSNFMAELHFENFSNVPISSDNTGALTVATNILIQDKAHRTPFLLHQRNHQGRKIHSQNLWLLAEFWRTVRRNTSPKISSRAFFSKSRNFLDDRREGFLTF